MYTDVTPEWARGYEKAEECSVVVCAESETRGAVFAVVDHSIQTTLAYGVTQQDCYQFLNTLDGRICPTCGARRMVLSGQYYCPPCDDGDEEGSCYDEGEQLRMQYEPPALQHLSHEPISPPTEN